VEIVVAFLDARIRRFGFSEFILPQLVEYL